MILSFGDPGVEDLFYGRDTKAARKVCPTELTRAALRRLELLDSVDSLEELKSPPGNRLESLRGSRRGQHSIRINDRYRICVVWTGSGPADVEIVDYH